ncbi:MAG: DUF3352 domain-containing protein [Vicinamibacteria bacterium]
MGVLVGGCGGGDGGGSSELASFAPPDAPLFGEGVIRPEGDQREAIESFAERVGGISDPGAAVIAAFDDSIGQDTPGVTYAEDIEPWLGDHAAFFVSSFEMGADGGSTDAAGIVEVDDAAAAREFIPQGFGEDAEPEQRSYAGADYYFDPEGERAVGVIDDEVLVVGTETAFKVAVDASQGESLAESEEYTDRVDALPDDPLGSIFFEPAAAVQAAIASEGLDPDQARLIKPLLGGPLSQPVAVTLTADSDSAAIDIATTIDGGDDLSSESSLLTDLPAGSWFAAAVPNLGPTLERTLDQLSSSGRPGAGMLERQVREAVGIDLSDDVFSWLGDAAVFVEGTAAPAFSAGLIAQTSDPEAPRALVDALQALAEQQSGLPSSGPPEGADYGFSIGLPGVGGGAEAGVIGGELVVVLGATAAQALDPSETLGDDEAFQAAVSSLGDDLAPVLYVDLPLFFQVAEQGSDGDIDYDTARPYFDAFATLVSGSHVEDGLMHSRVSVSLADE